jgi:hypothetical protein
MTVNFSKIKILTCIIYLMAEAGIAIFTATGVSLAITIAILFSERTYRYRRVKEGKHAGTLGFEYEKSAGGEKREGAM